MAQASSAQREPSMEEILASIRRIIEDSDTARKVANDFEQPATEPAVAEVEAFREEIGAEVEFPSGAPVRPVSLAEIQAEIDRERGELPAENSYSTAADELGFSSAEGGEAEMPYANGYYQAESAPAHMTPEEPEARAENQNPRPAIISEHASRQIAASFEELSEAFAASRRRSFDEMAEEMLRPMLQDWLDNNLPVLVERLVREEIERVARGGAR